MFPVFIALAMLVLFAAFAIVPQIQLRRAGFDRKRRPPPEAIGHTFDEGNSLSIVGGSRIRNMNASVPLVRLRADREWVHLARVWMVPEVWIDRRLVTGVRRVHTLGGGAIRFDSADRRYDGVLFWSLKPRQTLVSLGNFGWPIET